MEDLRQGVTLRRRYNPELSLEALCRQVASLAEGGPAGADRVATGFIYTPRAALWVTLSTDGALIPPPGEALPKQIFELRLFDGQREWRWNDPSGRATAACVTEAPEAPPETWRAPAGADPITQAQRRRYLLWGTALGASQGGWSRLSTPRTGPFWVPVALAAGEAASLETMLYVGRIDPDSGAAGVMEERIVGLSRARTQPGLEGR